MSGVGTNISQSSVIGTASTLLEARQIARDNQGSEVITHESDGTYSVKKLDDSNVNQVKQKPGAQFGPSAVEFSISQGGKEEIVTNANASMLNKLKSRATSMREAAGEKIDRVAQTIDNVQQRVENVENRAISFLTGQKIPTDGRIFEGTISPTMINDLKSGRIKLPVYVKIQNNTTKENSYVQINQAVIDSIKKVEFPEDARNRYAFNQRQDTRDGTVTKGYGCTNVSLHKYLLPGKDAKAEKAAEAVLVYQALTHAEERFNYIPKVFLDNLDDSHKAGLLSTGFNMSAGMFAGGKKGDPTASNPNGFLPIKRMNEYWSEITKGDGSLSLTDVKDAINSSFGSFISGFREGQSGLYARRTFDFIVSMGTNPEVSSPYGQERKLSQVLTNMLQTEQDPSKKMAIDSVISSLRQNPDWAKYLK